MVVVMVMEMVTEKIPLFIPMETETGKQMENQMTIIRSYITCTSIL